MLRRTQAIKATVQAIRSEMGQHGVVSFARFMELALYHSSGGYYETEKNPGRHGDFYTSVTAGPLFGQLLSFQFSGWLGQIKALDPQPSTLNLCEAGAHDGRLAADILGWLQTHRPGLFSEIEYCILEPSPRRRQWQEKTLEPFAPRVRWVSDFNTSIPHLRDFNGIIFSNELLDAMPVQRFGWDAKSRKWFEWGVTTDGDKFVWARIQMSEAGASSDRPSFIRNLPSPLLDVLPDGYTVESSPAAESWWRTAAGALGRGKLLTIDYGLTADELVSPSRPHGTLRAYHRHHVGDDVLALPGEQDLTAHVNFAAIQKTGEDAGLTTEFFGGQAKFLTNILANANKGNALGGWTPKQARQFQTLTHPEHLGRAFRVLVQAR